MAENVRRRPLISFFSGRPSGQIVIFCREQGNTPPPSPPPPPGRPLLIFNVVKIILVPRGRNPSGQHQGSRPLPGSSTGKPIFRPIVKSDKSDWLKMQNKYSAHASKIGSGQRSRFSVLTKRIAASGNKNA